MGSWKGQELIYTTAIWGNGVSCYFSAIRR